MAINELGFAQCDSWTEQSEFQDSSVCRILFDAKLMSASACSDFSHFWNVGSCYTFSSSFDGEAVGCSCFHHFPRPLCLPYRMSAIYLVTMNKAGPGRKDM